MEVNKNPFFSIIIPVYNVEKYLCECIDSVLKQKFDDYEIILVDDGSTDNSSSICDSYAKKYQKIKTIHQENKGLSGARNAGILSSIGKYLIFIDSDDYIAAKALEKLYKIININEIDVIFLEMIKFFPDGTTEPMNDGYEKELIINRSQEDVWNHIANLNKFPGSACSKAVKRSLITEDLYFVEGLISEDLEWCYRLFNKAETYSYLEYPFYYYRQLRQGSISNSVSSKSIESTFWIIKKWANKDPETKYQKVLNAFISYQYMIMLYSISKMDKSLSEKYFIEAKKYRWLLGYGGSKRVKMVNIVSKFLGIKNTAKILNYYKKR